MVQNTPNRNIPSCYEVNEFQVVHALITQSLKASKDVVFDENANGLAVDSSKNHFISAVCQTFHSIHSANQKRAFHKSVKQFISQIRETQENNFPTSSSFLHEKQYAQRRTHATHLSSSVELTYKEVAERNVLGTQPSSLAELSIKQSEDGDLADDIPSSNVQSKVLQFEKQANSSGTTVSEVVSAPVTQQSCTEVCPGGTFYRPVNPAAKPHKPKPPVPPPPPAPEQVPSTQRPVGHRLKRVPSERFQKMRRKVQKLMQHRSDAVPPTVVDETTFLQSIRIPLPTQARNDFESNACMILRLPDHVFCQIFSLLDTRTLASVKSTCSDFSFIINNFDIRSTDSRWTKDERYLSDPCKHCRHVFVPGDMSMCRFHPKRYYSDLPYGRSYWMCCLQYSKSAPGCRFGLHDNHWLDTP